MAGVANWMSIAPLVEGRSNTISGTRIFKYLPMYRNDCGSLPGFLALGTTRRCSRVAYRVDNIAQLQAGGRGQDKKIPHGIVTAITF